MLLSGLFQRTSQFTGSKIWCPSFGLSCGFRYLVDLRFKPIGEAKHKLVVQTNRSRCATTIFNSLSDEGKQPQYLHFGSCLSNEERDTILPNMLVMESFLNENEENTLLSEIEPYMKRLRYEFSHWDNAIHGYRETERLKWNKENTKIIDRVRECAFLPGSAQLHHVHILDLAEDGYIKPHIDSVRFCGNTIAGLSLLTDSVMRLVHDKDKSKTVDVFLKRRSMYIMRDAVRYDYTHEILPNADSKFKEQKVQKKRRISIICRNEPSPSASS